MTLIGISRLSATSASSQTLPLSLQLTSSKACSAEADRFSLNSNLSGSSPHSSLTSPLSADLNGSPASICCLANTNNSPTNPEPCLIVPNYDDHQQEHNNHHQHVLQQTLSLPQQPEKVRRLSRSEHRQSLSDLGYGKIESYAKLQRLGKGTYATVYMGRSRLNNDLVALKEILKEHDEGAPCTAIREVSLLRLLRHNNIVTLHDICHTPKKLTLVFEYVGPDLYAYMKENNHLLSIHNVRVS